MAPDSPGGPALVQEQSSAKDRLLTSAIRAFSDRGFYGARIEDIVSGAGVNVRMIYHYYGSKEGLYDEAILLAAKTFFQQTFQAVQFFNGTGIERLERAMTAYGLAVLTQPDFARMMVWERTSGSEAVNRLIPPEENVEVLFENLIRTALCEKADDGHHDPKLMATLCVGSPYLLVSEAGSHGLRPDQTTAMMDTVWKLALKSFGLTTEASSA